MDNIELGLAHIAKVKLCQTHLVFASRFNFFGYKLEANIPNKCIYYYFW